LIFDQAVEKPYDVNRKSSSGYVTHFFSLIGQLGRLTVCETTQILPSLCAFNLGFTCYLPGIMVLLLFYLYDLPRNVQVNPRLGITDFTCNLPDNASRLFRTLQMFQKNPTNSNKKGCLI
jgi:hypothetical protein